MLDRPAQKSCVVVGWSRPSTEIMRSQRSPACMCGKAVVAAVGQSSRSKRVKKRAQS